MSAFHLQDLLVQAAAQFPERTFLFQDEAVITYAQAALKVDQIASGMLAHGVREGDRVLLVMENRVELALLTLAATRIGAVFSVLTSVVSAPIGAANSASVLPATSLPPPVPGQPAPE